MVHTRLMWYCGGGQRMNSRKADRRRGRGGQVAWLFTPRLTDLDNGATASDSDSVSLSVCSFLSLSLFLSFSLHFFLSSSLPLILSSSVSLLAHRESGCCTQNAPPLCCSSPPLLPHVCSFSRQAGLKSQLRILSRLDWSWSATNPPHPHLPSPAPDLWVAGCSGNMDEGAGDLAELCPSLCKMTLWPHCIKNIDNNVAMHRKASSKWPWAWDALSLYYSRKRSLI